MGRSKGSSRQPGIPDSTEPVFGRYDKPLNGQNDSSYQPFDNIVNVRDVGAAVNRHCGLRIMRERVLYRSATPDDASSRDKQRLVEDLHLATIMDLRGSHEHQSAANKRLAASMEEAGQTPPLESTTAAEHLINLPGVNRVMIDLAGRNFQMMLVWRLSWTNLFYLLSYHASGNRKEATKILAANALQPRGLIGLGHDTLAASTPEILTMMTHFSQSDTYPVLIHCSQGKDRTGITIALLLLLLSESETDSESEATPTIPLSAIIEDYALSESGLQVEREDWILELGSMGLGPEFAGCAPGFVEEVKRYLDEKHGGVRGYLRSIGVGDEVMAQIRRLLLEDKEAADSVI